MSQQESAWKRRKGSDISHVYPVKPFNPFTDIASACNKTKAAQSDLADEIKGVTKRCMHCSARVSGLGTLAGIRKEWDKDAKDVATRVH